ncbi:magnesium transport protein CorA [Geobacter metallireducens GS-15]|uniref:Magnesium transport protein CorA n=1 Tax=Geobacter metallireducens (strain ATCC 53774 / DSM 7210 / GS-15) TaxID=269799 RepID=Q39WE8_GEOMG|nr:magnesium/cobalt transporter CorA [Geobacter metallireducens]ABB31426.2 magnesium transport protein CorA [Geobacter metallireducens GS-15]
MRNKLVTKRSAKAGLPPGTLVHIGERHREAARVSIIAYDEKGVYEQASDDLAACFPLRNQPEVSWINVEGIHSIELLQKLGECYGIHPLVLEDILNTDQRPKREDYGAYLFIVLKMLSLKNGNKGVAAEQMSLILGENFVLSFQEGLAGDPFDPVRERLRAGRGKIRSLGADYLVYSLIDAIIDNYFVILESLAERIERLEEELVANPVRETVGRLHILKREVIFLRKSIWPLREVISGLERRESSLVREETAIYLRDVYDHTVQIIDTVETFRDILSGLLDIYLSTLSNRTNEVMKVLTIIATLFMPLTFIAGLYGMNFHYMPELNWRWGYPAVLILMLLVIGGMLVFFRRKKWI